MSNQQHDIRVIYIADPHRRAIPAPELMVRFKCPTCDGEAVLDAFQGPPVCQADRVALVGISVVVPEGHDPYGASGAPRTRDTVPFVGGERDSGALDRTHTDELDREFGETTPPPS